MIKPINHNQLSLATKSVLATKADLQVATDLIDTLNAHQDNCVGMAANMIGVSKRIIVWRMGALPMLMINPVITNKSDTYQTTEGCLSLDGERETTRFKKISVSYMDSNFKTQTSTFTDFFAQIIQHEVDHCNGVLI